MKNEKVYYTYIYIIRTATKTKLGKEERKLTSFQENDTQTARFVFVL